MSSTIASTTRLMTWSCPSSSASSSSPSWSWSASPSSPSWCSCCSPSSSTSSFQRQVLELARLYRRHAYHPALSKWSERGWPDLALVRPPRLVFAELKSEKGKVTEHQERWLGLLEACPGVEVFLWRPSDLERVAEVLR